MARGTVGGKRLVGGLADERRRCGGIAGVAAKKQSPIASARAEQAYLSSLSLVYGSLTMTGTASSSASASGGAGARPSPNISFVRPTQTHQSARGS